jgi:chromosome segregation ATPase
VTENAVVEILSAIQADLATVKADLAMVKTDVAAHTRTLNLLQQDTGMIRGALNGHTRMLDMLQQDTRMIRGAVNDMAKTDVTAGEVEAIHHDLNRAQREIAELTARLEVIEARYRH